MVWSKIAQVFSFGSQWGDNTIRVVEGNDASAMLKRVEGILEDSMRVLSSHERVLSQGEFDTFSIKYRNLTLKVVEVKQEVHGEQTRGIFSASPAGRQPFRLDQQVALLYRQARIYQRDVLTASRRAQAMEEAVFNEIHGVDTQPGSSEIIEARITLNHAPVADFILLPGVRIGGNLVLNSLASSTTGSETSTLVDRQPYLAIAHVRPGRSGSTDSTESADSDTYREILILESEEKTIVMINPNRRHLNKDFDPLDESSIQEMSRAGEALLRVTDPHNLQGYEVIGAQQETSWVDSFVNTLSRLGVGIGADMM
ncbi:hypothetical protein RhiXN_03589 [Rhizoctonia solani]|uniref:Uncharacterized protein n=1 Tax=Rhizoctonia solani TaxID=456999 RepID=A0A8H8NN80_9AGAM|nr:uncharacterized protein RhiXN_03589 [Rhizoctonia solani]QRW15588.1 hypothetical protein RhiXN_03589 [Rhizoctonia solani]